jgi:hypothetical protein
MPMHNWKRVPATIYHHFHQQWTVAVCNALNSGMLPDGYSALVEQYAHLQKRIRRRLRCKTSSGTAPEVKRDRAARSFPARRSRGQPLERLAFPFLLGLPRQWRGRVELNHRLRFPVRQS